jgi:hypothetical protein
MTFMTCDLVAVREYTATIMKIDPLSWMVAILTGRPNNNKDPNILSHPKVDRSILPEMNDPVVRPSSSSSSSVAVPTSLWPTGLRGTLWNGGGNFDVKAVSSSTATHAGNELRICFRNRTDETVLLCWVGENGTLHHFYSLHPWNRESKTLRVANGWLRFRKHVFGEHRIPTIAFTDDDHVETTVEGHVFVIVAASDIESVQEMQSLDGNTHVRIVGAYRADPEDEAAPPISFDQDMVSNTVHLVEVVDPTKGIVTRSSLDGFRNCRVFCRPKRKLKDENDDSDNDDVNVDSAAYDRYVLTARLVQVTGEEVYDTTQKHYEKQWMGRCKWPMMMEPKWDRNDPTLGKVLERDLDYMACCLPAHALTLLRDTNPTPIWVNHTLKYGPKSCPIQGRAMCFHPGADWLIQQGMSSAKSECVELYKAAEYREMRECWGTGGILIHEFSHAYHHKGCKDGYDNRDIIQCYDAAMKEGLYDSVRVHGPQGPSAKAYACTNAMEYFAELSTAFLGGIPNKSSTNTEDQNEYNGDTTKDEEFNKWYPFNRQQIREHDPRAYDMLKKIWKVDDA